MDAISNYQPNDHEMEVASNSYLMSLFVLIMGLPLPIINLISSAIFYFANRKKSFYIRWHCTQALFSQLTLLPFNSAGFWWTIHIIFGSATISSSYIAYLFTLVLFNSVEFFATIMSAVRTRKGEHISWWLCGPLTNLICKPAQQ